MLYHSYEYRYTDSLPPELLQLHSIGRQCVSSSEYVWDGMKRIGDGVIFQYSLSGEGRLDCGRHTYNIAEGHALLVTVPGEHRYYYDASSSKPWDFLWIRLSGAQASSIWNKWIEEEGPAAEFRPDSETIVKLQAIYDSASEGALGDMWSISVQLYDWLLTLLKRGQNGGKSTQEIPDSFARVASWMASHYSRDISLLQLAEMAGVTKHHFCKMFANYYHTTPIQYLRKKRIEEAAALLRHSRIPITNIASMCGFADLGYFGKVFRQYVGVSPTDYRDPQSSDAIDVLKLL